MSGPCLCGDPQCPTCGTAQGTYGGHELTCANCGCEESAHGGDFTDEGGEVYPGQRCTGCGEVCEFEEADDDQT